MTTIESNRQESGSSNFPEVATVFKPLASISPQSEPGREDRIAIAAYYLSERRGFAPEDALADWLAAEREIDISRRPNV
jgi:hypothetical protein